MDTPVRTREQFLEELGKALQRGECWGLVLSQPRPEQAGDGILQVENGLLRACDTSELLDAVNLWQNKLTV